MTCTRADANTATTATAITIAFTVIATDNVGKIIPSPQPWFLFCFLIFFY